MPHRLSLGRLTAIILLLTLTNPSPLLAAGTRTLSDVQRQIDATSAQLEALNNEIASTRVRRGQLQRALERAQSSVGEREQRLQQLSAQIAEFDQQLSSLDASIDRAKGDEQSRRKALVSALQQAQQIGRQSGLKIILQQDDPALADRLSVYTSYLLAAQQQSIVAQAEHLQRLNTARERALKDRHWLAYIEKKAYQQRQGYLAEAGSSQRVLGEVEAELDRKTRTVAELKADQSRLQSLVEELRLSPATATGYFALGKGSYPAPVVGELHARFNEVKSVGKLRWSGLFIQADYSQPVRAIADGEVVYASFLRGFGLLVIIDHGDGYSSLYGGNREIHVATGQWVESGATIATVGDASGQSMSGVYFEIRLDAEAIDPEPWLRGEWLTASNRQ